MIERERKSELLDSVPGILRFRQKLSSLQRLSLCRLAAAPQTEVHTQMPANMASTSCLSLNTKLGFCPPKHNNETQNGVLHIGHFRSALKHCKGLPFRFFVSLLHRDEESTAVLSGVMESQSCANTKAKPKEPDDTLSRSERETLTLLIRQLDEATTACSMFLSVQCFSSTLTEQAGILLC